MARRGPFERAAVILTLATSVSALSPSFFHVRARVSALQGVPASDDEHLPLADRVAALPPLPLKDEMLSAISADGFVSAKAIVTSTMVRDIATRQECLPLAAAALGRAVTCTLLLADGLKQEETFQVRFQGDGPLNGVMAVANGKLEARGFVGNPKVSLPPNAKGKLDVGGGVGKGQLFVVRAKQLPGDPGPSPYSSITNIRSGEVGTRSSTVC